MKRTTNARLFESQLVDWIHPDGYRFPIDAQLTLEEMLWLSSVGTRLMAAGDRAATRFGWNYVRGVDAAFQDRGYCSPEPQRFFNQHNESNLKQDNEKGAFHPNNYGYEAIGTLVHDEVASSELRFLQGPVIVRP